MSKHLKTLTPGTVQEVVHLAEEYHLGEKAGEGKGLNQRYLALEGKVESLTDDQKDELLALMWLGRGAAGETVGMWAELLENARHEDAEGKVGTLMIRASQLGNYLPKGLERLGA